MTPQHFLAIRNLLDDVIKIIERGKTIAWNTAMECPLPIHLRPATSKDIVKGNILWYPECKNRSRYFWKEVGEVLNPNDDFKAYYSDDGCRYGLDEAFVECAGEARYSGRDPEKQSHQERHLMLHKYLDELASDFIEHTGELLSKATIMDLLEWSNGQTRCPTEVGNVTKTTD